ncbi:MAG TPA: hypothetical protein V6C96_04695 [Vampirovibrionales bacterium]
MRVIRSQLKYFNSYQNNKPNSLLNSVPANNSQQNDESRKTNSIPLNSSHISKTTYLNSAELSDKLSPRPPWTEGHLENPIEGIPSILKTIQPAEGVSFKEGGGELKQIIDETNLSVVLANGTDPDALIARLQIWNRLLEGKNSIVPYTQTLPKGTLKQQSREVKRNLDVHVEEKYLLIELIKNLRGKVSNHSANKPLNISLFLADTPEVNDWIHKRFLEKTYLPLIEYLNDAQKTSTDFLTLSLNRITEAKPKEKKQALLNKWHASLRSLKKSIQEEGIKIKTRGIVFDHHRENSPGHIKFVELVDSVNNAISAQDNQPNQPKGPTTLVFNNSQLPSASVLIQFLAEQLKLKIPNQMRISPFVDSGTGTDVFVQHLMTSTSKYPLEFLELLLSLESASPKEIAGILARNGNTHTLNLLLDAFQEEVGPLGTNDFDQIYQVTDKFFEAFINPDLDKFYALLEKNPQFVHYFPSVQLTQSQIAEGNESGKVELTNKQKLLCEIELRRYSGTFEESDSYDLAFLAAQIPGTTIVDIYNSLGMTSGEINPLLNKVRSYRKVSVPGSNGAFFEKQPISLEEWQKLELDEFDLKPLARIFKRALMNELKEALQSESSSSSIFQVYRITQNGFTFPFLVYSPKENIIENGRGALDIIYSNGLPPSTIKHLIGDALASTLNEIPKETNFSNMGVSPSAIVLVPSGQGYVLSYRALPGEQGPEMQAALESLIRNLDFEMGFRGFYVGAGGVPNVKDARQKLEKMLALATQAQQSVQSR